MDYSLFNWSFYVDWFNFNICFSFINAYIKYTKFEVHSLLSFFTVTSYKKNFWSKAKDIFKIPDKYY